MASQASSNTSSNPKMNPTTPITPSTKDYVLEKPLPNNQILVRHIPTGTLYLGTILPLSEANSSTTKMATLTNRGAGSSLMNLLNHENLISIQTTIIHRPFITSYSPEGSSFEEDPSQDASILLWEYADAGSLGNFLDRLLSSGEAKTLRTKERYLPEGMVWTVMLGMLRALMWLHLGMRDIYTVKGPSTDLPLENRRRGDEGEVRKLKERALKTRCEKVRSVSEPEVDWWPILHRDIKAKNVFLQHPRGIESYGLVKLGNFGKAYVSGGREIVIAPMEGDVDIEVIREGRKKILRAGGDVAVVDKSQRPYHTGTELYFLGRILFNMMTGYELPPGDECPECGCFHLHLEMLNTARGESIFGIRLPQSPNVIRDPRPPCPHEDCKFHDVNVFSAFLGVGTGYSDDLKGKVVEMLLGLEREVKGAAANLLEAAWPKYLSWCENTEEGRLHRDLWDDLWAREVSAGWQKVEGVRALMTEEDWQRAGKSKGRKRKVDEEEEEEEEEEGEYEEEEWDGSTVRRTERGFEIIYVESEESD